MNKWMAAFISLMLMTASLIFGGLAVGQGDVQSITKKILDKDLDGAFAEASARLKNHPADAVLLKLLGQIEYERGRYAESAEFIGRSLNADALPSGLKAWNLLYLGMGCEKLKKPEEAVVHYRDVFGVEADRRTLVRALQALRRLGQPVSSEMYHKIAPRDEYRLEGKPAPDFALPDLQGRMHTLSEWKGSPLFIHLGTTWCGGCQGEGQAVEKFVEKYKSRGVVFLKVNFGESEAALKDFLNHYRADGLLGLVDFNCRYIETYGATSWPTTVIVDEKGIVRYHSVEAFYHGGNQEPFEVLDGILSRLKSAVAKAGEDPDCENGACSIKSKGNASAAGDFHPRLAVDGQGRLWMAYISDRDGDNNVYLRGYDGNGKAMGKDVPVSRSLGDDYACDIAVASDDSIWITWVSNRTGVYDVFLKSYKNGEGSKDMKITRTTDDAFGPRLAAGPGGRLWITYYRWNTNPENGVSRDRDVFARFYDGTSWSEETEVNPLEPKVEDHSDPAVAVDGEGRAWIAWSFDYHQRLYANPLNADLPTIFAQKLADGRKEGNALFVGVRETGNDSSIDVFPSLAAGPGKDIWCAWDAFAGTRRVILTSLKAGDAADFSADIVASDVRAVACTPSIAVDRAGVPALVWRQLDGDRWRLYGSRYRSNEWSEPFPVSGPAAKNDCSDPVLVAGTDGALWVAFTERTGGKAEVRLVRFAERRPASGI